LFQLVVCVVFLLSLAVDFTISTNKLRFLSHNFIFILVSIPYLNIIYGLGLMVS
jgi:voltage-gated potassium channel